MVILSITVNYRGRFFSKAQPPVTIEVVSEIIINRIYQLP
jgi:hypothetical protein